MAKLYLVELHSLVGKFPPAKIFFRCPKYLAYNFHVSETTSSQRFLD